MNISMICKPITHGVQSTMAQICLGPCNLIRLKARGPRCQALMVSLDAAHEGSSLANVRGKDVQLKLHRAYIQGKRHINVQNLCKEVGMERKAVLDWFKAFDALPESTREGALASARRSLEEEEQRKRMKEERRAAFTFRPSGPRGEPGSSRPQAAGGRPGVPPQPSSSSSSSSFSPDWARTPANKKLSAEVLATLEMVYQQSQYPSDEILKSLWDLHRLPRRRLVDWFAERRRRDRG
eukprot:jgi/Botrbrau1/8225/Bobra.0392s0021.1